MKRRLVLRSEHLTDLTRTDLAAVAGGYDIQTHKCFTGMYPTINTPCPTVQECAIAQTPLCPTRP